MLYLKKGGGSPLNYIQAFNNYYRYGKKDVKKDKDGRKFIYFHLLNYFDCFFFVNVIKDRYLIEIVMI